VEIYLFRGYFSDEKRSRVGVSGWKMTKRKDQDQGVSGQTDLIGSLLKTGEGDKMSRGVKY
jgi:hypothetical protein